MFAKTLITVTALDDARKVGIGQFVKNFPLKITHDMDWHKAVKCTKNFL